MNETVLAGAEDLLASVPDYFTFAIRILLVVLALAVVLRCAFSLLREKNVSEIWCWLAMPDGTRTPIRHWENLLGRAVSNDVVLDYPTVSRTHAALLRQKDGTWLLRDLRSRDGIRVNGEEVRGSAVVRYGDLIETGGLRMALAPLSQEEQEAQTLRRPKPGRAVKNGGTLFYFTLFSLLLALQHTLAMGGEVDWRVPLCFCALAVLSWITYWFMRALGRTGFELETLAFFLCSLGLSVVASADPESMGKTLVLILGGVLLYLVLGWVLRDLGRVKALRWPVAAAALALLLVNLVFGRSIYGSANWVQVGSFTFQPSEFVKLAFVFVGAATLDRLFTRRNLFLFALFTVAVGAALAIMGDFGTAIVFFVAFLVIAFMRSGDIATVVLSIAAAVFAVLIAMRFRPYMAARLATYGRAWDFAYEGGYQQTRTMSAAASGGLLGLGAGRGWMRYIVFAGTDLVFGILSEELGLLVAVLAMGSLVVMAVSAVKFSAAARSSYYTIAACAAAAMFLTQMMLNVFGSVDVIPLTGITFPFVSQGGTSMLACWGLLAFLKAADTRRGGSFAVRPQKPGKKGPAHVTPAPEAPPPGPAAGEDPDAEARAWYENIDWEDPEL